MGGPGSLSGPLWVVLGRSQGLCGRSWAVLGPLLAVLGRLGSALRCYVGGLGPLLGPMLAVLAALGASVGGPGPSWAEKWPKPERESDPERGRAGISLALAPNRFFL